MGIELLALYGDGRMGSFLPGLRRGVKKVWAKTPGGAAYNFALKKSENLRRRHGLGDDSRVGFEDDIIAGDEDRLGAFLPGLTKVAKKIGKVTSPYTTAIAKSFLPSALVDAAAGFDPTKKGGKKDFNAMLNAVNPPVVPVRVHRPLNVKKIAIIAGAGVGALVLIKILTSHPQQPRY